MVFEFEPPLDPADNPYMPRRQQSVRLNLDPDDFAVPYILPKFPLHKTGMIDSGHVSSLSIATPMHDDMDEHLDDFDDNSSDSLDSLEDHEFPLYFTQRGTPPRLFHSHGTYNLPVDGDEMKVCITTFCITVGAFNSEKTKQKNTPAYRGRKRNISNFG